MATATVCINISSSCNMLLPSKACNTINISNMLPVRRQQLPARTAQQLQQLLLQPPKCRPSLPPLPTRICIVSWVLCPCMIWASISTYDSSWRLLLPPAITATATATTICHANGQQRCVNASSAANNSSSSIRRAFISETSINREPIIDSNDSNSNINSNNSISNNSNKFV